MAIEVKEKEIFNQERIARLEKARLEDEAQKQREQEARDRMKASGAEEQARLQEVRQISVGRALRICLTRVFVI